jgi:hypothetical protein
MCLGAAPWLAAKKTVSQMTSPTSELVGLMGRHERIVPKFAQKKLHRSDGRGA